MLKCPASHAQIDSACMSYRHDFGLMKPEDVATLRIQAQYWLEAWMKEGLVFDVDDKQQEIDNLRKEVAELKEKLAVADASATPDAGGDFRTQIILLQSENGELKRQLEQATDPEYLAAALGAIGATDMEWKDIAEKRTEQVAALNSGLKVAQQGIDDWMHVYAHDLCDEADVKAARDRVYKHGTLAYIAEINQTINEAYKVASYEDVLPEHDVIGKVTDAPILPTKAYLTTDKDGSTVLSQIERVWSDEDIQNFEIQTTNLVDGERANAIIGSLRYETLRLYNEIYGRVESLREKWGKASGTQAEEAAWDMGNRVISHLKQIKFDASGAFKSGLVISDEDADAIKQVLEKFDQTLENQKNNGPDAKLAVIANYGDIALNALRKIVNKAGSMTLSFSQSARD